MVGVRARQAGAAALAESIFAAEDDLLAWGCRRDRLDWGEAFIDAAHPSIYDVNSLRAVFGVPSHHELEDAFTLVRRGSGCRHKRVVARDPDTVRHLDRLLLTRGYQRQVCVAMALFEVPAARPLPPGLQVYLVSENDEGMLAEVARCQDRVRRDEPWYSPEVSVQMDEMAERQMRDGGARFVAAVDERGAVAGTLLMACNDGLAFIADVGTVPAWRGSGIASALLTAAAGLAHAMGCTTMSLTARRDDKPRRLYERLGFQVVGESVDWLRAH